MTKSTSSRKNGAANPIPETKAMDIPFDKLTLSDDNVRKEYDPKLVAELAESIGENGLIQSLSVRPVLDETGAETGMYEVQAGGRRYRALQLLVKKNRREADKLTPCVVKTAGFAVDDSYVENAQREALHPIDEFRAFQAMLETGKTETEIASTHRVSVAFVRQRLRLASASPVILKAFRKDEMKLDQLMAFCIVEDHARQERVWKQVKGTYNEDAYSIRQLLTEDTIPSTDRRVRFVGLAAYEKAGGNVTRDLFSTTNEGYVTDTDLLNTLVDAKLEEQKQALLAAGWKWAETGISIGYDRKMGLDRLLGGTPDMTAKEKKQHAKLTAEMEQLDAIEELSDEQDERRDEVQQLIDDLEDKPLVYANEDMANAGAFVSIDYNGNLAVEFGYIKPEDHPSVETDGTPSSEEGDDEPVADKGKPLSGSLVQNLTAFRTVAIRNAVAQDFDVAFVAVLHAMALSQCYSYASDNTCLQLKLDRTFPASAPGLDEWAPTKTMADRDLYWKKQLPQNSANLWEALLAMDDTSRKGLFAHLASQSVNAVDTPHFKRTGALLHADHLEHALNTDMVKAGWTTNADNYLNRVSKGRIVQAVTEARGEETSSLIAHMKKEGMAMEAERLLAGTGWLPEPLRSSYGKQQPDTSGEEVDEANIDLPEFLAADEVQGAQDEAAAA